MESNYKNLKIWQEGMILSAEVYRLTKKLPSTESFGLVSQMRRASVSIVSNIAEGAGRNSNAQFVHFLSIAQGSAFELETQLLLLVKLEFVTEEEITHALKLLDYIQKMNFRLRESLSKK